MPKRKRTSPSKDAAAAKRGPKRRTRARIEGSLSERARYALAELERRGDAHARDQLLPRFGIRAERAFGTSMEDVRALAKTLGHDHELAHALWATGVHEARALAAFVADPEQLTPAEMDRFARDFGDWATCDTLCFSLFDRTPHALAKVRAWSIAKGEFQRRAAFAVLAGAALHRKDLDDDAFLAVLPLAERAASDGRNFVKKAVSWALRSSGARSRVLHAAVLELARRLARSADATERWIGRDVVRDLERPMVAERVARREAKRASTKRRG